MRSSRHSFDNRFLGSSTDASHSYQCLLQLHQLRILVAHSSTGIQIKNLSRHLCFVRAWLWMRAVRVAVGLPDKPSSGTTCPCQGHVAVLFCILLLGVLMCYFVGCLWILSPDSVLKSTAPSKYSQNIGWPCSIRYLPFFVLLFSCVLLSIPFLIFLKQCFYPGQVLLI